MKTAIMGVLGTLLFFLTLTSASASLIINEVDYDQPGSDQAEFIELLNSGPDLLNLDGYTLLLFNGATETFYRSFDLSGYQIEADSYFVLCGNSSHVANCNFDTTKDSSLIQNGGSKADAITLNLNGDLIDSLVYEGNLEGDVVGQGDQLNDHSADYFMGLSRLPNGYDSNNDNHDFQSSCITPGFANTISNSHCIRSIPEPTSLLLILIGLVMLIPQIRDLQIRSSLRTTLLHE